MEVVAWFGCALAILLWFGWCASSYFFAQRKSHGEAPWPSLLEMFGNRGDEHLGYFLHRQQDRHLERLRLRVWLAAIIWFAYMLIGFSLWAALARLVGG